MGTQEDLLLPCSLPDTQSQRDDATELFFSQEYQVPWGQLHSFMPGVVTSVDLLETSYALGRSPGCQIIMTDTFPQFYNVSKWHFKVTKEENVIYLKDTSRNGTFVNGRLVGKGKKVILIDKDIISFGLNSLKVFRFDLFVLDHITYIPHAVRQKYCVTKLLGRGACGEVRLAFNKETRVPCALKKITVSYSSSSSDKINGIDRVRTEIQVLVSLSHPFIIGMYDLIQEEMDVFIALEYMEGGDLTKIIPLLDECDSRFIFYQIMIGVKYLHSNGITHRDLKPDNILLSTDLKYPVVKISDFGLSKIKEQSSMMDTVCGTLLYTAPEILSRLEKYDKKVDVWSAGVILFFMLSKAFPFTGNNLCQRIINGTINWSGENSRKIPPSAQNLIKKILVVNPVERFDVNDVIKHQWIASDVTTQHRVHALLTDSVSFSSDEGSTFSSAAKRIRLDLESETSL